MAVGCSIVFLILVTYFSTVLSIDCDVLKMFESIKEEDVMEMTKESCILAFVPFLTDFSKYRSVLESLQVAFKEEPRVRIGVLRNESAEREELLQSSNRKERYQPRHVDSSILFYPRRKVDRTCLTPNPEFVPTAEKLKGYMNEHLLLSFLNSKCQTFRTLDGKLTAQGMKRQNILQNLFRLPRIHPFPAVGTVCERIKMPSEEEFVNEYLYRSRPVIIEGWCVVFLYCSCVVRGNGGGIQITGLCCSASNDPAVKILNM